jgi:hypothetical protein
MPIKLTIINRSATDNIQQVALFQKNVAPGSDGLAVAWRVVADCRIDTSHFINFPVSLDIGAVDSAGNAMPPIPAQYGQTYRVDHTPAGDCLSGCGCSGNGAVQVRNDLSEGLITADIYKDGSLLARQGGIAPGQQAAFEFKPTIWVGAVANVVEGEVMSPAALAAVNTELSLQGIASADIVMTGGGPGPGAGPYQFKLENIRMA